MTTDLTTRNADPVAALAQQAQAVTSYAAPAVALRRPLPEVVGAALDAAGRSNHTRRAYETAIALFLAHLDRERGKLIPEPEKGPNDTDKPGWRPLVQKNVSGALWPVTEDTGKARSVYVWSEAPAAVLRLVDADLLDGWAAHRRRLGDTDNTITSRVAAVRTFLAVALRDNILTQEQAVNLGLRPYQAKQRRSPRIVGRRLSKKEVRGLRAAVDTETAKGKRDRLILDLGLYLGLRQSEIAGLTLADFAQDKGRWWVTVKGKGRKTRRLKLPDPAYQSWAAWCQAAGLTWHDDRPLLYSVLKGDQITDRAISPTDVARQVAAYGAAADLAPARGKGRLGAHDLRRTCARNAYDNGAPLLLVQKMLGHSDPKTTAAYIGLGESETETATDFVRY